MISIRCIGGFCMNQTTKRSKELKEVHVGRNEVAKSVTGISLEAPKYSCIETKQDGVKVILEFPEFDETRERTEAGYHQLEIHKEVNNVLSHTLREQIKNHQIYHVERIS